MSRSHFPTSPLIRLTLMLFYFALLFPLPVLAQRAAVEVPVWLLIGGILLGAIALVGVLSEQVILNDEGIQVAYPVWVPTIFRQGWSLPWAEVTALKSRSTGQGGLVYYLVSRSGQGYLLPMRVAGFAELTRQVQARTGIDTTDVRPLSQPWMYFILLGLTGMLGLVDGWILWLAISLNRPTS